jgi:hypothetical protein
LSRVERISALRCSDAPDGRGLSTNIFTPGVTSYDVSFDCEQNSENGRTWRVYVPGAADVGAGEPESLPCRPRGVGGLEGAMLH